ncbi:glycoside hydrolase family 2 TIM barrel-domain containing protein [Microbacterium sp.]|uniref:glycoside hydrolase family 2 protein n=1 Tax=Microbacterium sp. TaxID=51671 RepID=UPI0028118244|nr:glycoside hydrolase family 2 TIM barrel-domain containing protein [Microbacterium sp.]
MPSSARASLPQATANDGTYPRPQLVRSHWRDLGGRWGFAFDDDDRGTRQRWHETPALDGEIIVPFPPESPASGVGDTSAHQVLWYHRVLTSDDIAAAGHASGRRLILRFGAVDYRAVVWVNGHRVGSHEGGHTPFSVDITDAVTETGGSDIVVRVEDDAADVAQPRGKQDWREHPHVIWYHRTSGIWQPVWVESVPTLAVEWIHWRSDLASATVHARMGLSDTPTGDAAVDVELSSGGTVLARTIVHSSEPEVEVVLSLSGQSNGQAYEELLWSPEHPRLIDASIHITDDGGRTDSVSSYLGLRSAAVDRRLFLLNDRPRYVRSVLSQGYWPESHLAAPSADALRDEVQLIKDLGFNATRVHQKFEDPRFLYWADRLGLMVWSEAPATFTFTSIAAQRTVREWLEVVHRDFSHPSIVTWVPLNESWGVQHIAHDARMLHFARSLVHLTKALDPTRPVVSNDGWEQADTDILAIHDYEGDGDVMRARYRDRAAIDEMVAGVGPAGRRLVLSGDVTDLPVMLTEFGGISFDVHRTEDAWGYSAATSTDDFGVRLRELMSAIHDSSALAGYCYTQLTDTLQETNGLVGADRVPKLPLEEIREIMVGPRP